MDSAVRGSESHAPVAMKNGGGGGSRVHEKASVGPRQSDWGQGGRIEPVPFPIWGFPLPHFPPGASQAGESREPSPKCVWIFFQPNAQIWGQVEGIREQNPIHPNSSSMHTHFFWVVASMPFESSGTPGFQ